MRGFILLMLGVASIMSAKADCGDGPQVLKPVNGKLGYRMEIVTTADGTALKALVYRPFTNSPDVYEIVVERRNSAETHYRLSGRAGSLRLDVKTEGTATLEANREIPSLWKLDCRP